LQFEVISGTLGVPAQQQNEAPATAQTAPRRDRLKGSQYVQGTTNDGRTPMTIHRVPDVPFAQIANSALRDKRLSFRARGVLALVLSNVGEWEASLRWLTAQSDHDGRKAVQAALNELTELGYREVRYESHSQKVVTVVEWRHVSCRAPEVLGTDCAGHESGVSIEHHPLEQHRTTEHHRAEQASAFDRFWDAYPRKASKGAARTAWTKAISKADASVIIAAAAAYRDDPNREDGFTAHAATWLNQERWDDEPLPSRTDTLSSRERRLKQHLTDDPWSTKALGR
jgi:hypothetical protein